ncbi:unnamed protein product [Citrullus colocynthis]|uniref:Uncharacterized protein n=1 Tax=Citrullus colocynthis TaxID=252529 RepID=A0ABP0Z3Q3_9ROSI
MDGGFASSARELKASFFTRSDVSSLSILVDKLRGKRDLLVYCPVSAVWLTNDLSSFTFGAKFVYRFQVPQLMWKKVPT